MENKRKSRLVTGCVVALAIMMFVAGLSAIFIFSRHLPTIEKQTETVVILKEMGPSTDLPNPEEGTVTIKLKATREDVAVADTPITKLQLFRSKTLDGLAIYYLYEHQNVTGGIPKLTTAPVDLLDGKMHTIVYTFKRGFKQLLAIDGVVMAEGEFALAVKQSPTGFLVKDITAMTAPMKEVDIQNENVQVGVTSYGSMVDIGEASSPERMG
jgi:hypothetical protein